MGSRFGTVRSIIIFQSNDIFHLRRGNFKQADIFEGRGKAVNDAGLDFRGSLRASCVRLRPPISSTQRPLIGINGFMLETVILFAQAMTFFHKNDFTDICFGLRKPKFPSPRFDDFFGFHKRCGLGERLLFCCSK